MSNIQNKVVVITGASSGLGETTARHLAKLGAKVVLGARRVARLEKLVAEIKAEGGEAIAVATDVTVRTDVENLVQNGLKAFGKIDAIVNNAGVMPLSQMSALRVDEWEQTIDVNVKGVMYGIAAVLPLMTEQKSGHIINLSSVAGLKAHGGAAMYCASKFAVKAMSEGLREEMSAFGVRVTTLYPGAVDSELQYSIKDEAVAAGAQEFYKNVAISADSIARAIAYVIEQPADVSVNEITIRPTAQAL